MPINYKGTTVKHIDYKGTNIKKAFKWDGAKWVLVFNAAFSAYVKISCWDRSESKTEQIDNPEYPKWETKDGELHRAYYRAQEDYNEWLKKNPGSTIPAKNPDYEPWKTTKDSYDSKVSSAKSAYDSAKSTSDSKYDTYSSAQRTTASKKSSYDSASSSYSSAVTDYNNAVTDYNNAVSNVASARKALEDAIRGGQPQFVIDNLQKSLNSAISAKNSAESAKNSAKSTMDSAETSRDSAEDAYLSALNSEIAAGKAYNEAASVTSSKKDDWDAAKRERDNWLADNPNPGEYIQVHNPSWDPWEETRKQKETTKDNAWDTYNTHHNNPPSKTKPHTYTAYYPNTSVSLVGTPEEATGGWIDVSVYYGGYTRTCRITKSNTYQSWEGSYDRYSHSSASGSVSASDGGSDSNSSFLEWTPGPFEWEYN